MLSLMGLKFNVSSHCRLAGRHEDQAQIRTLVHLRLGKNNDWIIKSKHMIYLSPSGNT